MKPSVSVVVCTRNRGQLVKQAIDSILANTHSNYELILIDQSTNDETQKCIPISDPRVRYIRSNTKGKGIACNIALKAAKGEIIAYTDDDCVVPSDWVEKLEKAFNYDPQIALVFCSVVAGEYDFSKGFVPVFEIKENRIIRTIGEAMKGLGIGAGMALRKSVVERLGGFDNALGPGAKFKSGEDHDIALRLLLNKYWIYEFKDTTVIHYGFRTWKEGRAHTRRDWFSMGAAYIKWLKSKHPQGAVMLFCKPVRSGVTEPLRLLLSLRKPQGLFRIVYLLEGVVGGLRTPVDQETGIYRIESVSLEAVHGI